MSEQRQALVEALDAVWEAHGGQDGPSPEAFADAVLERFDLTPKKASLKCAICLMTREEGVKKAKAVIDGFSVCTDHIGAVHSSRAAAAFEIGRTIDRKDGRA